MRCDDTENDPRVDLESCRRLGVRSILAAPVRYERDTVGLLMVFAPSRLILMRAMWRWWRAWRTR